MKKWIMLVAALLLFAGQVPIVNAEEIDDLKEQMARQAKLLKQMQQQLEQLEASQKDQQQKVDEKISQAVENKQIGALPDSLKWAENIKWSGDFRYRHESIDDDTKTTKNEKNVSTTGDDFDLLQADLIFKF